MADTNALGAPLVAVTINGNVFRITRGRLRVNGVLLQWATTGQTLDIDGKAWMNTLAGGVNNWSAEVSGVVDYNIAPANRPTGNTFKVRPGTTPPGIFQVLLAAGFGFAGTLVFEDLEIDWDVEGTKPVGMRGSGKGDGPLTYINS